MPFQPWVGLNSTITIPLSLQGTGGPSEMMGAGTTGDTNDRVQLRNNGSIAWSNGSGAVDTILVRSSAGVLQATSGNVRLAAGSLDVAAAGQGLQVAEGSNAKQGTAVLVAGTVTVANTSVTANSKILLTAQVVSGTQGILSKGAVVAGTSFVINSSNAADTSTVAYEIFEPG